LFVTTGELLVFIDADLTQWDTHFITGLLGPLLTEDATLLVKGFYDRVLDMGDGVSMEGGRVTELVARPIFALHWPQLSALAQPLAGEWAVRRSLFESLPVPVGYGVELAAVIDTVNVHGVNAIAQVDLGRRAHRHQNLHDLGVMATELLNVANRRRGLQHSEVITLPRIGRDRSWRDVSVPSEERPPAANTRGYPARK
jgi:glucosyl-3-phosphoglycerate synthase